MYKPTEYEVAEFIAVTEKIKSDLETLSEEEFDAKYNIDDETEPVAGRWDKFSASKEYKKLAREVMGTKYRE